MHGFPISDFCNVEFYNMPIIFWVTVYVESITGTAKKTVTCQHVDRTGTMHSLMMEYFLTPGELHLAEGKVYNVNGSCLFQTNIAPIVGCISFQLLTFV